MANFEKTKEMIQQAKLLAEECFGAEGRNPQLVAVVLQCLAIEDCTQNLKLTAEDLANKLCMAAAVAAGD